MGKLILLHDYDAEYRRDLQEYGEMVLRVIAKAKEDRKADEEIDRHLRGMTEDEKVEYLDPKKCDVIQEIDRIQWQGVHDIDKKLISIPGLKKLKGGLH